MICGIAGCNKPEYQSKSLCRKHFRRLERTGDPLTCKYSYDPVENFVNHISHINERGCWISSGTPIAGGYRRVSGRAAHRLAWKIYRGALPDGLYVCHHCDNPPCVNPDHLFLGTPLDNMVDMITKGRDRKDPVTGVRHYCAKLNPELVREARALFSSGATIKELASKFSVHWKTMQSALVRKTWKEVA